jgi:Core-2/I-Branching enzyme
VSLAYLIRAHHRAAQLARLVSRLAADGVSFYIHVSATATEESYAEMRSALDGVPRLTWTPRVKTRYGGFSLLEATLTGLETIASHETPGHVVQLSGQDYPLRPATEIREALAARETLLEHFELPSQRWHDEDGGLDRIRYLHFERFGYRTRVLRLPLLRRPFPGGLRPYGGSAFWALSAEALRFVVSFTRENARVVRFFRRTHIPDELFVPTILLNSPLRHRVENEPLHHVEWPGGAHPKTLAAADFETLARSRKLFARKFDEEVDVEILDRIDRRLLGVPVTPVTR